MHETGVLDLLTKSGRHAVKYSLEQSLIQLTNGQHTCELVFKPKADILNIRCDYQFVFSVLDELFRIMLDAAGIVLKVHYKSLKCNVSVFAR